MVQLRYIQRHLTELVLNSPISAMLKQYLHYLLKSPARGIMQWRIPHVTNGIHSCTGFQQD
jgi:hypothetical protein